MYRWCFVPKSFPIRRCACHFIRQSLLILLIQSMLFSYNLPSARYFIHFSTQMLKACWDPGNWGFNKSRNATHPSYFSGSSTALIKFKSSSRNEEVYLQQPIWTYHKYVVHSNLSKRERKTKLNYFIYSWEYFSEGLFVGDIVKSLSNLFAWKGNAVW